MGLKLLCLLVLILLTITGYTQKIKGSWYVSISPTIGNTINTYTFNPGSYYKDSLRKLDRWRSAIGASAIYALELQNKNKLMVGLQFQNFGFTRKRENYKFLDTLHPEIGQMFDMSQTGSNYINFNYRYQYLTIPVLYSTRISGRSMKSSTIHWMIGGSVATLINHDIRAVLHGFSARGKKVFILNDGNDNPARFNINLQTGFRLENLISGKNTYIFVQPTLYLPILNANYGIERHHLYALSCEVGFIFKPQPPNKEQ